MKVRETCGVSVRRGDYHCTRRWSHSVAHRGEWNVRRNSKAALGLFVSVIWTVLYFVNLVFPQKHALFQYICFPLMALGHVTIGFYLTLFAVKSEIGGNLLNGRKPWLGSGTG